MISRTLSCHYCSAVEPVSLELPFNAFELLEWNRLCCKLTDA